MNGNKLYGSALHQFNIVGQEELVSGHCQRQGTTWPALLDKLPISWGGLLRNHQACRKGHVQIRNPQTQAGRKQRWLARGSTGSTAGLTAGRLNGDQGTAEAVPAMFHHRTAVPRYRQTQTAANKPGVCSPQNCELRKTEKRNSRAPPERG